MDLDIGKTTPKRASGSDSSGGETVGRDVPHALTQGLFEAKIGINPPVGWLVCIDGPERGMDYRIRSENNSIGRSETMRVCIAGDEGIARENHAFLTYDPESNTYFIRPGIATGMVYHNRTPVFTPIELKPFDEIKLGKTTLLFVPLCGEFGARGFKWA